MRRRDLMILAVALLMTPSIYASAAASKTVRNWGQASGQGGDVSGEWQVTIELPGARMPGALSLTVDGERVTGKVDLAQIGQGTLRNGRWVYGVLSFNLDFPNHDPIAVVGRLTDGKLAGECDMKADSGSWHATRK